MNQILATQYWGRGFATEAARGALRVGYKSLGLREIVSFTSIGNALREHCLYRLSHQEWIEQIQS